MYHSTFMVLRGMKTVFPLFKMSQGNLNICNIILYYNMLLERYTLQKSYPV